MEDMSAAELSDWIAFYEVKYEREKKAETQALCNARAQAQMDSRRK